MIRVVLSYHDGFAIQRRGNRRWTTFQTVNTAEQAEFVVSRLDEPIHYTSVCLSRPKRVGVASYA